MEFIKNINYVITLAFLVCYSYQIFYLFVPLFKKQPPHKEQKLHRFGVLICARNEENVIGQLIESIKNQDYPSDLIDIFVLADNCSDNTALVARNSGATVWERFDCERVGKGYALGYLLHRVPLDYDGYFVFDADNLVKENFIFEMNQTFCDGYKIITSLRKTKNVCNNWISFANALCFLRESTLLNYPRMLLGTSCSLTGTGFLFSKEILIKNEGWNFYRLTEDVEFTLHNVLNGEKIGYCKEAIHYDEQPENFRQSWIQRKRWTKGYFQVIRKYGLDIMSSIILKRRFDCYDLIMTILPAVFLSIISCILNTLAVIRIIISNQNIFLAFGALSFWLAISYIAVFILGAIITFVEWHNIEATSTNKIKYLFTFPVFMATYIPIVILSLFKEVTWEPISHTNSVSIHQLNEREVQK